MWRALTFEVLDLAGGGYLPWFARCRQQELREPVILIAVFLIMTSAFLIYVARKGGAPDRAQDLHADRIDLGLTLPVGLGELTCVSQHVRSRRHRPPRSVPR